MSRQRCPDYSSAAHNYAPGMMVHDILLFLFINQLDCSFVVYDTGMCAGTRRIRSGGETEWIQ